MVLTNIFSLALDPESNSIAIIVKHMVGNMPLRAISSPLTARSPIAIATPNSRTHRSLAKN